MGILDSFSESISRATQLGGLHNAVRSLTTDAVDPSDLLRSQIVQAVSAFDYLIHEITVQGMLDVYDGFRAPTGAYSNFRIPLSSLHGTNSLVTRAAFESAIRDRHSYLSFQRPGKVADAIRLFSSVELWNEVGNNIGRDVATLKGDINLAIDRRNKIVHEADLDPSYPGQRWPIGESDAAGVVYLFERIGHGIVSVV